jgi:hypothetical protein
MTRRQILERERRWARPAGVAALLAAPLYILSVALDQGADVPTAGLDTERFRAIEAGATDLFASAFVRAVAFALLVVPLLYLFRAAQARSERVSGPMVGFVFIGPLLLAAQGIVGWVAQTSVASDFVDRAGDGGDLYTLLEDLAEDSVIFEVATNLLFPAILGLIVVMVYVPLQAMRVGLLSRFFATLGMALGAGTLFIVPAISLLTLVLWFAWLGLVILDRVPKGRPPAWDAGDAIPWPRPGEEPEPAVAAGGNGVIEGDAEEIVSPTPKERPARRDRARKRKRKRRG